MNEHTIAAAEGLDGAGTDRRSRRLQHFWARYFAFYDTLNEAPPYRRMVRRHAELLEPSPGDTILDAGAGTGNVSRVLAVPGVTLVGIDFCEPALDLCRHKVASATFMRADLTQPLPFEPATFDKIACSLVLHYLTPPQQERALKELHRVLRPGGRLAVTVFASGFRTGRVYAETLRELRREEGLRRTLVIGTRYLLNTVRIFYYVWQIKRLEQAGDYRFASPDALRTILQRAGFEVRSVEPTLAGQCSTALAVRGPADPARAR